MSKVIIGPQKTTSRLSIYSSVFLISNLDMTNIGMNAEVNIKDELNFNNNSLQT